MQRHPHPSVHTLLRKFYNAVPKYYEHNKCTCVDANRLMFSRNKCSTMSRCFYTARSEVATALIQHLQKDNHSGDTSTDYILIHSDIYIFP